VSCVPHLYLLRSVLGRMSHVLHATTSCATALAAHPTLVQ